MKTTNKLSVLLTTLVLCACSAPDTESVAEVAAPLTYNATMAILPGTTCNPTGTVLVLPPDPANPNMYLVKVNILNHPPDQGFWQNAMAASPYNASAAVSAAEYAAYCTTINTPGKKSQVTFYWDGSACSPSGHCAETQSPVITNL